MFFFMIYLVRGNNIYVYNLLYCFFLSFVISFMFTIIYLIFFSFASSFNEQCVICGSLEKNTRNLL